jgi:phage shock protein E
MMHTIKKFLGLVPEINYTQLTNEGAVILDVRTPVEFSEGHLDGAINIPIETLRDRLTQLQNRKVPIIACCNDGSKSWYAKNLLDASGYTRVYDAGSWSKLKQKLQVNRA